MCKEHKEQLLLHRAGEHLFVHESAALNVTEFDVPVGAPTLQAEAEVVHSIQILSWQGVVSQLPEVLGPQILPSVTRHRVIAFGGRREGWR